MKTQNRVQRTTKDSLTSEQTKCLRGSRGEEINSKTLHSLTSCVGLYDFKLLVEAQTGERFLDTKGGETSSWVLVPAVFHDLWHTVEDIRRLPAIRNVWPLVVDAHDLKAHETRIRPDQDTSIILQLTFLISSILGSGCTTSKNGNW